MAKEYIERRNIIKSYHVTDRAGNQIDIGRWRNVSAGMQNAAYTVVEPLGSGDLRYWLKYVYYIYLLNGGYNPESWFQCEAAMNLYYNGYHLDPVCYYVDPNCKSDAERLVRACVDEFGREAVGQTFVKLARRDSGIEAVDMPALKRFLKSMKQEQPGSTLENAVMSVCGRMFQPSEWGMILQFYEDCTHSSLPRSFLTLLESNARLVELFNAELHRVAPQKCKSASRTTDSPRYDLVENSPHNPLADVISIAKAAGIDPCAGFPKTTVEVG